MTNILGITLARGGSKGIPSKNIKPLLGVPLIGYTITQALKVKSITDYIVSTESEEIARVARDLGASVPFIRPKELAKDTSTSSSALIHALKSAELIFDRRYEYVVELMVTNPFKTSIDIQACLDLLVESGADSVIAVKRVEEHHPARIKKIIDGRIVNFCVDEELESRRQDLTPAAYIRCGAIYALKRDELIKHGRRYGSNFSLAYELDFKDSVNIDSPQDWLVAEYLMGRNLK
jgi:CMP-N,N'-diacetyllegionaminic acid synthase